MFKLLNLHVYVYLEIITSMLTPQWGGGGRHTNCVTVCIFKFRGNVWEY